MFSFLNRKKIIAVHDGSFHADDIFACATLGLCLKKKNISYRIIRTRNEGVIEKADYVVDVGGIYDHDKKRYDHHQTGGAGVRTNGIPFAAFGLIWKHYGLELCNFNEEMFNDIDRRIVQPIDAGDNGLDLCSSYTYGVSPITLQNVLHWVACKSKDENKAFYKVLKWSENILFNLIKEKVKDYESIRKILSEFEGQKGLPVVTLLNEGYNRQIIWQALLPKEEAKDLLFVVYRADNGKWNVLAMRKEACSFGNRKSLPSAWAGKRAKELVNITGVSDAVFVHNSLFLAVAETREGAEKLAFLAVEQS